MIWYLHTWSCTFQTTWVCTVDILFNRLFSCTQENLHFSFKPSITYSSSKAYALKSRPHNKGFKSFERKPFSIRSVFIKNNSYKMSLYAYSMSLSSSLLRTARNTQTDWQRSFLLQLSRNSVEVLFGIGKTSCYTSYSATDFFWLREKMMLLNNVTIY